MTAATYLAASSLATLALFQAPVAALALLFLAAGDPAAGLVGSRYARHRLSLRVPWGRQGRQPRSLEGALAFLVVAMAIAALLRGLGVYGAFWPAALGALIAALVELAPIPVEDNVSVPLVSAAVMTLAWAG